MTHTEAFPILHTPRLDLVELQPHHARGMFRLLTDPLVTEYYAVYPFKEEKELLPVIDFFKTQFSSRQGIRWGIILSGNDDIIGTIGFHNLSKSHKATVLFALLPQHHNQGYITEALGGVMKYGFEALDLKRIDAEVIPGNITSEAVLKKTGFVHEGLLRQWMQWNSRHYDVNMYAVLRENR